MTTITISRKVMLFVLCVREFIITELPFIHVRVAEQSSLSFNPQGLLRLVNVIYKKVHNVSDLCVWVCKVNPCNNCILMLFLIVYNTT